MQEKSEEHDSMSLFNITKDPQGASLRIEDYPKMSNEKVLFLFNKLTGMAPYTHQFDPEGVDSQMLSGFISAMSNFMGEVTGEERSEWKTVYGGDQTLLVEVGEWMVGVIAVSRETIEYRSKLRRIIREYETTFEFLKEADGIEGSVFEEFDHYARRTFINHRISKRTLLLKAKNWKDHLDAFELPSNAFKVAKLLHQAENGETLGGLANRLGLKMEEIKEVASLAIWHNVIGLVYVPSDDDMLSVTEGSSSILFDPENLLHISPSTLRVVTSLDGRTPLSELLNSSDSEEKKQTLYELGNLVNLGYIEHISPERRLVMINECILTNLYASCADIVGRKQSEAILFSAIRGTISKHPWAGRLRLRNDDRVYCELGETITPTDLDNIYTAIHRVCERIVDRLGNDIGLDKASLISEGASSECHSKLGHYIEDVVI